METARPSLAIAGRNLRKAFRRDRTTTVSALDGVSIEVASGALVALVGPDGAGKTTLMRLITGLLRADSGELDVLGVKVAEHPAEIQARTGYMPQKFGLYEDLSVQENLDLYADLHGVAREERAQRYARLMRMTALEPFTERLAGRLSGGMKQKLGLACALVRSPELLLLDEPTVGVDPLSRRELWAIILGLVEKDGLTVLLSTTSMDEAARCHRVTVLHEGRLLANGPPETLSRLADGRTFRAHPAPGQPARLLQAQLIDRADILDAVPEGGHARFVTAGAHQAASAVAQLLPEAGVRPTPPRLEDGFMVLLGRQRDARKAQAPIELERPPERRSGEVAVRVNDLVRRFGRFTAVDRVSFEVRRGEVFGLLGPNGAGKTTTFRMLCGLLPATSGTLEIAGTDLRAARDSARRRLGYVAQKFSLYGQLAVAENLEFFASAYGLAGPAKRKRIEWALRQFDLRGFARVPAGQIPGGYQRRLAMAAALLHEPEILFLDEPTSGTDPLARREFWRGMTGLVEQGVTVIVTTHFMEEAEYCDHIVIQDAGRVLARGTPAEVRARAKPAAGPDATMEDAFIAIVEEGRSQGLEETAL